MKIVITGIGALATVGIGARSVFENMLQGRAKAGGEIDDFDPTVFLGKKGIRHFDRTALLLASAARLALDQSRFGAADYAPDEIGVVVGSTHGSIQAICEFDQESVRDGPDYVNPQDFANTVINAPASRVAMLYQATGLNTTISTGTASLLDALGYSLSMMRLSRAKAIVCGAALGYSPEIARGYGGAGRLVVSDVPCVPFAMDRCGSKLAEAGAAFVLEEEGRARSRGAVPLAEVTSVGTAFATGVRGPLKAMEEALAGANLDPGDVSCVFSSASGSRRGDQEEGEAIGEMLGHVPVTACRSLTGDCLEASGALDVAAAVFAVEAERIPSIAGLAEVDPAFAGLDLVRGSSRQLPIRHVLLNTRDDSGHCASAVISRMS
jgi:3-oxoacyl-[acyl-carrier-protein] synthase II